MDILAELELLRSGLTAPAIETATLDKGELDDLTRELLELQATLADPGAAPLTSAEHSRRTRSRILGKKKKMIAILDMETDPFDNSDEGEKEIVLPFLAVLYSDEFETVTIWENDYDLFVAKLMDTLTNLPGAFTIYAHNGGKFDFMFLVHKLRGEISFKGRGIMRASIGAHELRDSYHIIPERLANLQKDDFDYSKMHKSKRANYKDEIIKYCISDCRNLLYFVKKFVDKYGFKISVGAAAIAALGEHYKIEKVSPLTDTFLRGYFFGGRVECIQGAGYFTGPLKLYDVNSMYPFVMASMRHPIGAEYCARPGKPNKNTFFVKLECDNNRALLARDENGDLTSHIKHGVFQTTIWEYRAALELGLISNVKIIECVDNFVSTDFSKFVNPLYQQRAIDKEYLETLKEGTSEYDSVKSEVLFLKLILNNAYGKFAQNPRRYKEHYLTDPGDEVPDELKLEGTEPWKLEYQADDYWIWSRPAPTLRFNNVGTSASITGAARSVLMRAIHAAKNPIYCDTDSLICEELRGHKLDKYELGAWDLEKEIDELIVNGKKLYAYKTPKGKTSVIKSKGTSGLTWDDMLEILYKERLFDDAGKERKFKNKGPTLTRHGKQSYIGRRISRTAPVPERLPLHDKPRLTAHSNR